MKVSKAVTLALVATVSSVSAFAPARKFPLDAEKSR